MQHEPAPKLPTPDALSAAHSERVAAHIRKHIGGDAISFATYMHEALYAPGLGYYAAGRTKFGADGDFVTAPEVSPLFGRLLARQAAELLLDLDGGEILEVGAGTGSLAIDVLRALQERNQLPDRYRILEASPDLAERQQQRLQIELPELAARVDWLSDWPGEFRGVILANEVLDALPFERFVRRDAGVMQLCVSNSEHGFAWVERPAPKRLRDAVEALESELGYTLPSGYASEVSLAAGSWLADLAGCMDCGVALLLDYGVARHEYYAADRSSGWLRCHFQHYAHSDPLILPGIQDITTWVDFTRIAEAAVASGLDVLGFTPQAQFLIGAGLEDELQSLNDQPLDQQVALSGQIKTLTLPGEMGENFKCIALGCGDVATPSAFQFADRTQTL